jgi:hypothetical protein
MFPGDDSRPAHTRKRRPEADPGETGPRNACLGAGFTVAPKSPSNGHCPTTVDGRSFHQGKVRSGLPGGCAKPVDHYLDGPFSLSHALRSPGTSAGPARLRRWLAGARRTASSPNAWTRASPHQGQVRFRSGAGVKSLMSDSGVLNGLIPRWVGTLDRGGPAASVGLVACAGDTTVT